MRLFSLFHLSPLFSRTNARARHIGVGLFFLSYLSLGLSVYQDYGVSWDEPVSRNNGLVTLKYMAAVFMPKSFLEGSSLAKHSDLVDYTDRDYGVAFELPVSVIEKLLILTDSRDIYFLRHLATFLVFFLGVFALFRLAEKRFSDWRVGLLAALIMILSPRLFAESFYNCKDAVFMALFAVALNTTVSFVLKPTAGSACGHAFATAVLIDVRLMGVILPAVTIILIALRLHRGEVGLRTAATTLSIFSLLLCLFIVALWPYLWAAPLENFLQAFTNMANFRWENPVLYLGESILSNKLPWHYIPVWIAITTPPFLLVLFLIGVFLILRKLARRKHALWDNDNEMQDLLFLGLVISPILTVIFLDSVLYDGWRQMYFIYPPLVLVAIRGLTALLRWDHPGFSSGATSRAIGLCFFISLLSTCAWMIRSHPFQNTYFNTLAGHNLKTKFDVDYWGLSSRQVLQYLIDNDERQSLKVWSGKGLPLKHGKLLLQPSDRERIYITDLENEADYVVTQYRWDLTDYSSAASIYELYYQIEVDNEAIISAFLRVDAKDVNMPAF